MKTTEEMITVMLAYTKGKTIEVKYLDTNWEICPSPLWDWDSCDYRIKPEPKYRPYTIEEFLEAQKKHGPYLYKKVGYLDMPLRIVPEGIILNCHYQDFKQQAKTDIFFWSELLKNYYWQDGTPCGALEE